MIKGSWKIPWEITEVLEDITGEMQRQNVTIRHTFREGNHMVDYLANLAINQTEIEEFRSFAALQKRGKCIINIEKAKIPYIRIKTKEIKPRVERHASI